MSRYSSATSSALSASSVSKPWPLRLDGFAPGFRRFHRRQRALRAIHGDAAMRAGADAGIIVAAPIEQVVARLRSRPRVVRHLVSGQPRFLAKLLRQLVERAAASPFGIAQRARGVARGERRALLDGELIEREVVGRVSRARGRVPRAKPRASVLRAHRSGRRTRAGNFAWRAQALQAPRPHCAAARARAGSASSSACTPSESRFTPAAAIAREVFRLDGCRIGFERDLRVARDRPMRGDGVEDRGDRAGPHQRRRAAAEEDARHGPPRRERGEMGKLGEIRAKKRGSSTPPWRTCELKSQ